MKGLTGAAAPSTAFVRRRRGTVAAVFLLVVFSLILPLAFLLGFFNRSGDFIDERKHSEALFHGYASGVYNIQKPNFDEFDKHRASELVEEFASPVKPDQNRIPESVEEPAPSLKDASKNRLNQADEASRVQANMELASVGAQLSPPPKDASSPRETKKDLIKPRGPHMAEVIPRKVPSSPTSKVDHANISSADETLSSCQLEFGSYCRWSKQHKVAMNDSLVKRLKDQLFVARALLPSIAKLKGKESLARDLKLNIQDHERILSEAISDPDLTPPAMKYYERMDKVLVKAQSISVDCNNVDKKLRQLLDLTEDEAHFHMKQSAFLYQLGIQTLAKSFHCLSMRLTVEFFGSPFKDTEQLHAHKLWNPSLQHFVIFSRNVLAVSVTINSTVENSEETDGLIFHVITDKQNFYAMKYWFIRNSYRQSTVQVLNFDDLELNNYDVGPLQMESSEEFHVSIPNIEQPSTLQMQTEYISVFGHSHFLLPEIFKNLKKVIVLDDDVVVQKDLQFLWNLDLEGKVMGAVEICKIRLGQMKTILGNNNFDHDSCAWMSGVNIINLEKWREHNITKTYQSSTAQLQITDDASWRYAALQASLIALDGEVHALDEAWIESGLGYNYGLDEDIIRNAVVLHYNGNMKPWLDLGIREYKKYWKKYLTQGERFMEECNVNL